MNESMRDSIWRRASDICEYCRMPQVYDDLTFEVEHVIARKHGGLTAIENLALACFACNAYKGPNIAGLDPETGSLERLFHPRNDHWAEHFEWRGATLLGKTAIGRVTIEVLRINLRARLLFRQALIDEGVFPPKSPIVPR